MELILYHGLVDLISFESFRIMKLKITGCLDTIKSRGGGTTYNGLYGEAPPERGTFFRLQVYKRVGISQV